MSYSVFEHIFDSSADSYGVRPLSGRARKNFGRATISPHRGGEGGGVVAGPRFIKQLDSKSEISWSQSQGPEGHVIGRGQKFLE